VGQDITRCQMLGKLLEDKLYAHQAIQDSVKVTDAEVKGLLEDRVSYMVGQIGSMDKIEYYNKSSEEEFKLFLDILKQKLTQKCKKRLLEKLNYT
jgi:peptidyl-prolyl cis-trans isomerase SurA